MGLLNFKQFDSDNILLFPLSSERCAFSLLQVDYTTVFVFRLLMFVDNGFAAGMGL